jgi:hypothetical protein
MTVAISSFIIVGRTARTVTATLFFIELLKLVFKLLELFLYLPKPVNSCGIVLLPMTDLVWLNAGAATQL